MALFIRIEYADTLTYLYLFLCDLTILVVQLGSEVNEWGESRVVVYHQSKSMQLIMRELERSVLR